MHVLLVEDDLVLADGIARILRGHDMAVDVVHDGEQADHALMSREVSVAVLDIGLPGIDGFEVVRRLRARGSALPVLLLTARDDVQDRVRGLELGADDYLVKPFSIGELKARIRVALRRQSPDHHASTDEIHIGALEINLPKRQVKRLGERVHLTPTEFNLLARLLSQAGQVVTHRQLLNDVWGAEYVEHVHYLRLYMAQLRAKLEVDPAAPELLLTETGVGYRFCELSLPAE